MNSYILLKNALIIGFISLFSSLSLVAATGGINTNLQVTSDSMKVIEAQEALSTKKMTNEANKVSSNLSLFEYLYAEDEVLKITIQADLQDLMVNKKDFTYRKAIFTIHGENKTTEDWPIKVKPRGKFRNRICDFPPLKLNFSDDALENRGIESEHDKLKLVTHCINGKAMSKENVLREFLVYQLYNELTDNSFRVQLVEISYVDLHNSKKPFKRYGFLIEDADEVAERLGGEDCDCHGMDINRLDGGEANLIALFQYMVGNEDWDITAMRNIKGVELAGSNEVIAVPYDFDFAGFVNTAYAIPDSSLGHTSVKQRDFKGTFHNEAEYEAMKQYFISKKDAITGRINSFKLLSFTGRMECLEYVKDFYQLLEKEEVMQKEMVK